MLRIHEEALDEFFEAVDYYVGKLPRIADEFADEVAMKLNQVHLFPLRFPTHRTTYRKALLYRFPYTIFFAIEREEVIVYAISHNSRRPDYWMDRKREAS